MRGFDLMGIGIDKETGHDAGFAQTIHRRAHDGDIRPHIQTAFGSNLVGILRDQRNGIGPCLDGNLNHLFGRGHLDVQVGSYRLPQQGHVRVLNMPAIAAQVNRDAIGPRLFADHGRSHHARLRRAPRLANGRYVIDVDVQSRHLLLPIIKNSHRGREDKTNSNPIFSGFLCVLCGK